MEKSENEERSAWRHVARHPGIDISYQKLRAEERSLPPDTRGPMEQWMPRPGRSALDKKCAEQEQKDDHGRGVRSISVVETRSDNYRNRRDVVAD